MEGEGQVSSEGRWEDLLKGRGKFLAGGLLIASAVVYLIVTSTHAAARYYLTVGELLARAETLQGRALRISGVVDGATIVYDAQTLTLRFALADVPADMEAIERAGGLAAVLRRAVNDPAAARVQVVYRDPPPDLLRHEAQAIVTGKLGEDGVFYADELLLKCPARYEEEVPAQAGSS